MIKIQAMLYSYNQKHNEIIKYSPELDIFKYIPSEHCIENQLLYL